jgi:hypothetical protein
MDNSNVFFVDEPAFIEEQHQVIGFHNLGLMSIKLPTIVANIQSHHTKEELDNHWSTKEVEKIKKKTQIILQTKKVLNKYNTFICTSQSSKVGN